MTLEFSQLVNANDALRTGTYNKTLTFTLSTTSRKPRAPAEPAPGALPASTGRVRAAKEAVF